MRAARRFGAEGSEYRDPGVAGVGQLGQRRAHPTGIVENDLGVGAGIGQALADGDQRGALGDLAPVRAVGVDR